MRPSAVPRRAPALYDRHSGGSSKQSGAGEAGSKQGGGRDTQLKQPSDLSDLQRRQSKTEIQYSGKACKPGKILVRNGSLLGRPKLDAGADQNPKKY